MKLRYIITSLTIFIFFTLTGKAGWIQKSEFKELERKIPGTNLITFDVTGNYFYTFSGDSCLRRWDVNTGEVLDSIKITFKGNYTTSSFSSDKKVFCIASTVGAYKGDSIFFQAYSLNPFKLIDTYYVRGGDNSWDQGVATSTPIYKIDYLYENKYFLLSIGYFHTSLMRGDKLSEFGGYLGIFSDSSKISKKKIISKNVRTFYFSNELNQSIAVLNSGSSHSGPYPVPSEDDNSIKVVIGNSNFDSIKVILDFFLKTINGSKDTSSTPQYYDINNAITDNYNSCLYFTTSNDYILRTYDYSQNKFLGNYTLPSSYSWISSSEGLPYIFISYSNFLRIISALSKQTILEIELDTSIVNFSYSNIDGGLLTLSNSNTINLYYPEGIKHIITFFATETLSYIHNPIKFYYTGVQKLKDYIWDFGDGETAQGISAIHSYKKTGLYSVKLDLIDSSGKTQTITKSNLIEIIDSLFVDFEVTEKDTNDYHIVKFKNNSKGDIISTLWDFGDGSTDTVFSPVHQYQSDWFYNVTLQVSDKLTKLKKSIQVSVFDSVTKIASDYKEKIKQINLSGTNCLVTEGHIENFKISPSGNYYLKYYYGSSFDKMYGYQFTIFDDNLEQKYYKTNYTGKNYYFLNNENKESILFLNNFEYSKYSPFFETEYDHYSGSYNDFILMDNNQNIWGFYQPPSEVPTLNKFELFGSKIQSYPLSNKVEDYEIVTTDKYLYYKVKRSFGKINLKTNILDTFSLKPINEMSENNLISIGLLGLKSGAIFVSVVINDYSTIIYKLNEKNEIIKTFGIVGSKIKLNKLVPIGDNLFGFIGSSLVQSYLILDSDLNIVYKKFFLGYPRDFEDLSLKNQNQIVLASSKMNQDIANFYFVTDTLPNWIVDRYLTSVQNPKTSNLSDFLQVYPNPASEYILVRANGRSPLQEIQIFDIFGNNVLSVETGLRPVSTRIDISTLPAGVYFVRIGEKVEKFIKMK